MSALELARQRPNSTSLHEKHQEGESCHSAARSHLSQPTSWPQTPAWTWFKSPMKRLDQVSQVKTTIQQNKKLRLSTWWLLCFTPVSLGWRLSNQPLLLSATALTGYRLVLSLTSWSIHESREKCTVSTYSITTTPQLNCFQILLTM